MSLEPIDLLALQRTVHALVHALEAELAALELSAAEVNALACLDPQTPLPLPKLMRATAQRPTTLTSVCDRLERRSLIYRQVNRHDRRSISVELTERGRAVQQEVHAAYSRLASAAGSKTAAGSSAEEGFRAVLRRVEAASASQLNSRS